MRRAAFHISVGALFVAGAALLLVLAGHFHDEYSKAHAAASKALRESADTAPAPTSLVSPEPFYRKANLSALGICGLTIIALVVAVSTKHPAWFVVFVICGALGVAAAIRTGVRV